MLTLLVFLAVLSILVLAHELGHFLAAKKAGIKVEEFGFGYPPRLLSKKIGETVYSLNLLPIGGFVRLYGEELKEGEKEKGREGKRAFWAKSKKVRVGVIAAGVVANFLLAVIVFSIVYSVAGIPTQVDQVKIVGIVPGSPAEKAGFKEDDLVLKVDGQAINRLDQFSSLMEEKKGQPVFILVEREEGNPCLEKVLGGGFPTEEEAVGFSCQEGKLLFFLTPRENPPENEGPLGVIISDVQMVHYPFWQMPFRGGIEGFKEAFGWTTLILDGLKKMVVDLVSQGKVPKDVAGPIGIFQITGNVAQGGFLAILQFIGILSVNLMVVNFLPFPALDGGRILFVIYEVVARRRPKPEVERWVNAVGLALVIMIAVLVAVNDLIRVWQTSEWAARFRSSWPF